METKIPEHLLAQLSAFVAQVTGLHFPPARFDDLTRGTIGIAESLGFDDLSDCIHWLIASPLSKRHVEALASNLTVGETYFFRDARSFEILSQEILPQLIHARSSGERRLRIWSAACCTGEEAYSIAIALRRILPDWENWNITLLATDINPIFLRKAETGIFGEWSFRDAPPWLRANYFRARSDGKFEIAPEIKRLVRFAQLNLAEDAYPALSTDTNAMDVIFCRNVLMYFTEEMAQRVIEKFHRAQMEGGWLFVSPTELPHVSKSSYSTMQIAGATMCRKSHGQPNPPPVVVREVPAPTPVEIVAAQSTEPDEPRDDTAALLNQAREFANQGQLAEALDFCERAVRADKLDPASHYLRAAVLQEQGEIEEAIRSLHRALYIDSRFALAHFALGNIAQQRGEHRRARRHFAHALASIDAGEPGEVLRESDGMTERRLGEILRALLSEEEVAA